jgi:EF-P beta-lysylation protein EpmB
MATILASTSQLVEATSAPVPWQQAIQRAVRDARTLLELLDLPAELAGGRAQVEQSEAEFPLFVPREFVARMTPGDPNDPLLRQVLATAAETARSAEFSADPVGDRAAEVLPGLLQKYYGRALLVTTGACAIHCRYCFRRQFPYSTVPKSPAAWQPAIEAIAADASLEEVILSGGDPLMLSDRSLAWLVEQLNGLPHIQRLRIHSRVPVVIPQRVCPEMLEWIDQARMPVVCVLHINHPREIDADVQSALAQLRAHRALLLNQAVLLRGVNDCVSIQRELSTRLLASGVLPYYLHQLDRVQGAAHFEVPLADGRQLVDQLRDQLSGYGVPKYVAEIAGDRSKRPL